MKHFVYIIQSKTNNRYYVGITKDIETRLERHNKGSTRSTKGRGFWELKYIEECKDKTEALRREKEIKARKSKKYIEKLIQKYSSEGGVGIKQN